jgi:hypothetical protein
MFDEPFFLEALVVAVIRYDDVVEEFDAKEFSALG